MKKAEKKMEFFKTIAITILFLVVMLMVLLHFNELKKRNDNSADNDTGDSFTLKSSFYSEIESISENMILPAQIAFKKDADDVFAICSGKNYMQEIYSLIESNIAFMFSSECDVTDEDSSVFDNAVSSSDFIYVKYHTPLPTLLLYLHSIDTDETSLANDIASYAVSEIILFPDENAKGSIFALTRGIHGEVKKYILKSAPESKINIADLEIYKDAGAMVSAKFHTSSNEKLMSSTLIFDDLPTKNSLSLSEGIENLSKNADIQSAFAEILNINPNKTGSYFDEEISGTVFMATHGTLSFTDKKIGYSTLNNTDGLPLSIFSGKDSEASHSIYECLSAAQSIASVFTEIEGADIGDGQLLLTSLFRKGETLVLKFGYFYDNIPIETENDALILEISSKKLTGISFFPAKIIADRSNVIKSIPASWVMSIAENSSSENEKYTLVYKYHSEHEGNLFAEWKPVKIKEQSKGEIK